MYLGQHDVEMEYTVMKECNSRKPKLWNRPLIRRHRGFRPGRNIITPIVAVMRLEESQD
jgi:hypothetical protein